MTHDGCDHHQYYDECHDPFGRVPWCAVDNFRVHIILQLKITRSNRCLVDELLFIYFARVREPVAGRWNLEGVTVGGLITNTCVEVVGKCRNEILRGDVDRLKFFTFCRIPRAYISYKALLFFSRFVMESNAGGVIIVVRVGEKKLIN